MYYSIKENDDMFNRDLFEKTQKLCGSFNRGGASEKMIRKCQNELEVNFSKSYIEFLKEFGEGGVTGVYIWGIFDDNFSSVVKRTKKYRESDDIPKEYVVIQMCGMKGVRWLICLDTSRMEDEECPVIKYMLGSGEVTEYAPSFDVAFDMAIEEKYFQATGHHYEFDQSLEQTNIKKDLPTGMGYRSCWAVVEGTTQKTLAEILLQKDTEKCIYREGLTKVNKAPYEDRAVLVTADYEGANYIIGDGLSSFFYNREAILDKFKSFDRVHVYMTERVSECHGFALLEKGEIKRLYCYDEEGIQNMGERLPEEISLGYHFPINFEEAAIGQTDEKITRMDEDALVTLAIEQMGIDTEKYPYEDVMVGRLV